MSGRLVDGASFLSAFGELKIYGSDLSETWITGHCAVGRHLLRIAPAADRERLTAPTDDVVVVADAILDNREELAAELGLSSSQLSEASDSDLIHKSFLRWDKDCVGRFVGDFAFAAVRPFAKQVFLARDHIGSRPLYYAVRGQTLLFCSTIEGIVSQNEWRWQIDERSVAEFLENPLFPVSKPFFKEVNSVSPGCYTVVRKNQTTSTRWWRPSTRIERKFATAAVAAAACRDILERAVSDRVSSNGRIGAHFSGGMDSTGVAVLASRALQTRGRRLTAAYTWSPPPSEKYPADHPRDERQLIKQHAEAERIPIRFGSAGGTSFQEFIDRPMELESDADLVDELPVLRAARTDGLRVLLSGWGGDEAFSAHAFGYLGHLLLSGKVSKARRFAHSFRRTLKNPAHVLALLWREVIYPMLPAGLYHRLSRYRAYIRRGSFISADLRGRHADLPSARPSPVKFGLRPNENLKRHVMAGHITMRMESWAAWSANYGYQYRYPLTDRRLLEFLFTLPPDQLFMNDQPRGLARCVLADCIPPSASKEDVANERLRSNARFAAWQAIADDIRNGRYADDCPWLDTNAFLAQAIHPLDQEPLSGSRAFGEVFAATRVWAMYRRARKNNWL